MTDYPSMDRLAELQQMIADFAKVERVPDLADSGRPENDVEHSFGLALTCWFLHSKIAPKLDLGKILKYALAHDIVELHAGDTFAFGKDKAHIAGKEERERAAIVRLREDWSDFSEVIDYTEKYMDKADEEAKFVKAVDKLLPLLMIELGEGAGEYWRKHGINKQNLMDNKQAIYVSTYVSPYYELTFEWLESRNNLPEN